MESLITKTLHRDETGLSTVEYIIILALVAVSGIGLWNSFGTKVTDKVKESTTVIDGNVKNDFRQ